MPVPTLIIYLQMVNFLLPLHAEQIVISLWGSGASGSNPDPTIKGGGGGGGSGGAIDKVIINVNPAGFASFTTSFTYITGGFLAGSAVPVDTSITYIVTDDATGKRSTFQAFALAGYSGTFTVGGIGGRAFYNPSDPNFIVDPGTIYSNTPDPLPHSANGGDPGHPGQDFNTTDGQNGKGGFFDRNALINGGGGGGGYNGNGGGAAEIGDEYVGIPTGAQPGSGGSGGGGGANQVGGYFFPGAHGSGGGVIVGFLFPARLTTRSENYLVTTR